MKYIQYITIILFILLSVGVWLCGCKEKEGKNNDEWFERVSVPTKGGHRVMDTVYIHDTIYTAKKIKSYTRKRDSMFVKTYGPNSPAVISNGPVNIKYDN